MTDEDLLSRRPAAANDGLRNELLARTVRRVRCVKRMRLASRAGLCLACFAAGAMTTFLRSGPEPTVVYVHVRDDTPIAPEVDVPPAAPVRRASAAELEIEAEKTLVKADSARQFRAAGDRYLQDAADYQAALRCYRNFMDSAEPADLTVTSDDTWLLTSLKRAREQENER